MFKLLIGYDGSTCARSALTGLQRAGLPAATEATVLAIADVWRPPVDAEARRAPTNYLTQLWIQAEQRAQNALNIAQSQAQEAAAYLQTLFPTWQIHAAAIADSPAWGLIKQAEESHVDLVVVGSRGVSALDRILLGSISQMVATHCTHSVHIGRTACVVDADSPVRLVIGYDGSGHADAVIKAVAARNWPAGSAARLLICIDQFMATVAPWALSEMSSHAPAKPLTSAAEGRAWLTDLVEQAAANLRHTGLTIETHLREGDPRTVLVQEAELWSADCLFVGARGLGRFERFWLGSVSTAVASRAGCSVEIVRTA